MLGLDIESGDLGSARFRILGFGVAKLDSSPMYSPMKPASLHSRGDMSSDRETRRMFLLGVGVDGAKMYESERVRSMISVVLDVSVSFFTGPFLPFGSDPMVFDDLMRASELMILTSILLSGD